nr:MAG TPA: ATP synthase subunit alpha [Caudoviricetes sp.]
MIESNEEFFTLLLFFLLFLFSSSIIGRDTLDYLEGGYCYG